MVLFHNIVLNTGRLDSRCRRPSFRSPAGVQVTATELESVYRKWAGLWYREADRAAYSRPFVGKHERKSRSTFNARSQNTTASA